MSITPDELKRYIEILNHPTMNPPRGRCLCGKARYATEREANRAARRMKRKGRDRAWEGLLRPYMCPERKGIWHVGHDGYLDE